MRPRIEELRQIIFCPNSKATVSELKEFCLLNDRVEEITEIFSEYKECLLLQEAELRKELSKKDAKIRSQEMQIEALENYLKR